MFYVQLMILVSIDRFLLEHPDEAAGVDMSQFSFQTPKPLQENYVRKRPARSAMLEGGSLQMPGDFETSEGVYNNCDINKKPLTMYINI